MTIVRTGEGGLSYQPCRYGRSRLLFRGPKRGLEAPYCAVIGGNETYGKFVPAPFAALLEARIGRPVVNLGVLNAGPDVFLGDAAAQEVAAGAQLVVVQALGAQNMSNRFYVVHPRRNDRFLRASGMLKMLFPDVDFSAFSFTGHMLSALQAAAPDLFAMIVAELQMAWQARMRSLAARLPVARVLLVIEDPVPDASGLGAAPLFVTEAMIAAVSPCFDRVLRVKVSAAARYQGTEGMVFSDLEAPAAAAMPGPAVHGEIAAALAPVLCDLLAGG